MLISAVQSSYSLKCQPVDYSEDPRALSVRATYVILGPFSSTRFDKRHNESQSHEMTVFIENVVISSFLWNASAS